MVEHLVECLGHIPDLGARGFRWHPLLQPLRSPGQRQRGHLARGPRQAVEWQQLTANQPPATETDRQCSGGKRQRFDQQQPGQGLVDRLQRKADGYHGTLRVDHLDRSVRPQIRKLDGARLTVGRLQRRRIVERESGVTVRSARVPLVLSAISVTLTRRCDEDRRFEQLARTRRSPPPRCHRGDRTGRRSLTRLAH